MKGLRRLAGCALLSGILGGSALAQQGVSSLQVDDSVYEDVTLGPANDGKVRIQHAGGEAFIPVDKIPPQLGPYILGYDREMKKLKAVAAAPPDQPRRPIPELPPHNVSTAPAAPPSQPSRPSRPSPTPPTRPVERTAEQLEQQAFDRDRATKVLFQGRLVEKSKLTPLTGYLVRADADNPAHEKARHGTIMELARRKADRPLANPLMELRPGLWEPTGKFVLLLDYAPAEEGGGLIRLYGTAAEPVRDPPAFIVGTEPTFDEWTSLRRK